MTVKNINDRINPESSKNIKATSAEELVLGLMLIYPEYRSEAASGAAGLSADDFSTEFSRRVFTAICELERTEAGFSKAMLGQLFTVEEMGRLEKLEIERRRLARNDREVLDSCIKSIKDEKAAAVNTDSFDDLRMKREELKKAKERKNS